MADSPVEEGAKRRRLPNNNLSASLLDDDFFDDDSSDSSYRPDMGELQEFRSLTEARVTDLIELVRDSQVSLSEFTDKLSQRITSMPPNNHEFLITELRFAMANSIQLKKWGHLEALIEKCPPHLLVDVFSGFYRLTSFAIKIGSVEAVRLLLEHGASHVSDFSVHSLETMLTAMDDAVDNAVFNEPTAKSFLEMFRLLIEFDVDISKYPHLIYEIAIIAGRSPEIGRFLLENTPSSCLLPSKVNDAALLMPSPLFKAFESLTSWVPIDVMEKGFRLGLINQVVIARISSLVGAIFHSFLAKVKQGHLTSRYGIFGLLKNGAPLYPCNDKFLLKPGSPINVVTLEKKARFCRLKQLFLLTRLVMEARERSDLNVGTLLEAAVSQPHVVDAISILPIADYSNGAEQSDESYESDDDKISSSDVEADVTVDVVVSFLRSQFPRQLQAICRTAILRLLPIGPKRSQYVKSLEIPPPLTSYLLFDDLRF